MESYYRILQHDFFFYEYRVTVAIFSQQVVLVVSIFVRMSLCNKTLKINKALFQQKLRTQQ